MASAVRLQPAEGLGVCQSRATGQTALLAEFHLSGVSQAGFREHPEDQEPVGWHTLRHSLGTLMKANGEDVKTIQETLRHANFKVTMDVYTQGITAIRRSAHSKVVRQIMGMRRTKAMKSRGGFPQVEILIEPFQTHVFSVRISASLLFCWRPRRDLNPCYRRESGSKPNCMVRRN